MFDVICFGSSPTPSPLSKFVSLSQSFCVSPVKLILTKEGRGWVGAKSCDGEKAWYSINHSLLSGVQPETGIFRV